MAKQTYWFDGRQISEDEALENEVVRDGVATRFSTFMTDSAGNVLTDAFNQPLDPTYNRRGYVFSDNTNRSPLCDDDHRDVRKFALSNAWKGGHFEPGDAMIYEGKVMVGTKYTDEGHVEFVDIRSVDGDQLKSDAYQQYKEHLSGAWKTKQKEPSEREWEMGGSIGDGKSVRDAAYEQSCRDLQDAWRGK